MKKLPVLLLILTLMLSGCTAPGTPDTEITSPVTLQDAVTQAEVTYYNCGSSVTVTVTGDELEALRTWTHGLELEARVFEDGNTPNDVEGGKVWSIVLTEGDYSGFRYRNNGENECCAFAEGIWYAVLNPSDPPVTIPEEELGKEHHWDLIPMVMVDGQLYYDTGRRNNEVSRCGVMDGEITSSVEGWEVPTEDNQSNFGSGYSYQWGSKEGEIEVKIEDNWLVFEARPGDGSTTTAEPEDTAAEEAMS
ncbi:MAG: hypothetical protein IJX71_06410 [Oscillospiraceae bacterium]|nr:hypothetical protein [Oscillospiraceae bacterium]